MNYTCPKKEYTKKLVSFLYMFFDNGDYFEIKGSELIDINIKTYDQLVVCDNVFAPIAESGYIKLKICSKQNLVDKTSNLLHDNYKFRKNRKSYIENRCIGKEKITKLFLFNKYNFHNVLIGNFAASLENDILTINVLPQTTLLKKESNFHNINIAPVIKENIFKIILDFENCEGFSVYSTEILDINLKFSKTLSNYEFERVVNGGHIVIKLDKNNFHRDNFLFNTASIKDFEKRLCSKKGEDVVDICNLYISYNYGFSLNHEERICVEDFKTKKEIDALIKQEDDYEKKYGTSAYFCIFESGYSKKLKNGSIIIAFGKNGKETIQNYIKKHF